MGTLSPIHWIIVAVVILLLFGPSTLSKAGRGLGRTVRSVQGLKKTLEDPLRSPPPAGDRKDRREPASASREPEPTATEPEQRQG